MRLHRLHVSAAYLEKASSASSSSSQAPSTTVSPPFSSSPAFPFTWQCLRPLAPKTSLPELKKMTTTAPPPFEFGRARNGSKLLLHCTVPASGTTRWNPSAEQIKVLETLYRGGMRSPNAVEIERITAELGKFGRIEGKNVFYWFQNHKARERQKQKRAALLTLGTALHDGDAEKKLEACEAAGRASCKRRCRTWGAGDGDAAKTTQVAGCIDDVTLVLFPLHPQGKA